MGLKPLRPDGNKKFQTEKERRGLGFTVWAKDRISILKRGEGMRMGIYT